jgi:hypothetical protein
MTASGRLRPMNVYQYPGVSNLVSQPRYAVSTRGQHRHGLTGTVLYPLHKAAVKLEFLAALNVHKAPYILCVLVLGVYRRGCGDGIGVPIEGLHSALPL